MTKLYKTKFLLFIVVLFVFVCSGQNNSKVYKETFKVADSAILEINTSYADIEFDTWDKNEVSIEATVILEGATEEDAAIYFKNDPIQILGSSKRIVITSNNKGPSTFSNGHFNVDDFSFNMPEVNAMEHIVVEIPELPEMPELPELPEMPPLPSVSAFKFDYKAYEEEGEAYLKKWQKDFDKNFDKDYQKKIEAWSEKMEAKMQKAEIKREQAHQEMEMAHKEKERAHKQREYAEIEAHKVEEEHKNNRVKKRTVFISRGGKTKNFTIKKKLKIMLPKSTKMNLNIRHGEVKLAQQTFNLKATLSHSNLSGNIIEGNNTMVNASYSPVAIQKWNYGSLKADYSDYITLDEVLFLNLNTTSSDVTINKILKKVVINNKFGPLKINYVDNGFKDISITMQNAELECNLPNSACNVDGLMYASELTYPESVHVKKDCSSNTTMITGYHKNNSSKKNISIDTKFSEVVLK
ncbi:hypothetical protein CLV91_2386 [Maribacter vaceletii]|uniref:Adhesin domain-containing protein n=1 Tax=Maribacter vaceletii TaxID=1206816 RepID=A0A495E5R1_9FLAO|nr:hypothetical protein [Maribacter vaceletii]RKR12260.1 hypothetical protein CLV91_2386 [Maribacter vaceletii]